MRKWKVASFISDPYEPYIMICFPDGSIYKYYGFELGFFDIMKRKYKRNPGALANYLKKIKNIKCSKIKGPSKINKIA